MSALVRSIGKTVYIHSYIKDDDKNDKAGMVDDLKEVIKATGGKIVKTYESAAYCIFSEKFVPAKPIKGRRIQPMDIREALFNHEDL